MVGICVLKTATALLVGFSFSVNDARANLLTAGDAADPMQSMPANGPGAAANSGDDDASLLPGKTQQSVSMINGEVPPGTISPAEITLLLHAPLGDGQVLYQYRAVRPPGTRAPIHSHQHGGSTCMIKGETTLRVEGIPGAQTYRAGQCFFMPSGPAMANFNSGKIPFIAIDTFILRAGEKPMKVLEAGQAHIYDDHL